MTERLLRQAQFHAGAFVAAFVCAAAIAAPLLAFPFYAGESYQGINISHYGTDEDFYLARANEVLSGNGLGQPFLAEGKNRQDPTFYNIERIVLFPAVILGLSSSVDVVHWYNTANIIGIFVLTLVLYALAYALFRNRLLATATAVFILLGHSIIFYKSLFYTDLNVYGRSIFPYAASIPFFAYTLFLYKATVEKHGRITLLAAGACLGLLFYVYFYAWTFALALLGCLFLISLIRKDWTAVKATVGIGVIGVLIGAPLLVSFARYFGGGDGAQIAYFLRATSTHDFVGSIAGLVALMLTAFLVWRRPRDKNISFLFACVLAGWVALEQQVLTGRVIEYGHYYWYFVVPFAILCGIYAVASLIPAEIQRLFAGALITIALINTGGGQYKSFLTTVPEKMHDQAYADVLHILNTMPYGVVLAGNGNEPFPLLVTTYTRNDLYFSPSALVYYTSSEQLQETLLTYLALHPEARRNPIAYLEKSLASATTSPEKQLYQDIEGYASGLDFSTYNKTAAERGSRFMEERAMLFSVLEKKYRDEVAPPGALRTLLMERGVRYVLVDTELYPAWNLAPLEPLTTLSANGSVTLYELAP